MFWSSGKFGHKFIRPNEGVQLISGYCMGMAQCQGLKMITVGLSLGPSDPA